MEKHMVSCRVFPKTDPFSNPFATRRLDALLLAPALPLRLKPLALGDLFRLKNCNQRWVAKPGRVNTKNRWVYNGLHWGYNYSGLNYFKFSK